MARSRWHDSWCVLMVIGLAWPPDTSLGGAPRYEPIIQRVLRLLPKPPSRVVIVETSKAADDVREALRSVDAFILKGGRVVYLTSHNPILQGAVNGWPLYEHMLAAIIWHEIAHIDGADEREAQRREEALWTEYVMTAKVDQGEGMRYLTLLIGRRRGVAGAAEATTERTLSAPFVAPAVAVIEGKRSPDG